MSWRHLRPRISTYALRELCGIPPNYLGSMGCYREIPWHSGIAPRSIRTLLVHAKARSRNPRNFRALSAISGIPSPAYRRQFEKFRAFWNFAAHFAKLARNSQLHRLPARRSARFARTLGRSRAIRTIRAIFAQVGIISNIPNNSRATLAQPGIRPRGPRHFRTIPDRPGAPPRTIRTTRRLFGKSGIVSRDPQKYRGIFAHWVSPETPLTSRTLVDDLEPIHMGRAVLDLYTSDLEFPRPHRDIPARYLYAAGV